MPNASATRCVSMRGSNEKTPRASAVSKASFGRDLAHGDASWRQIMSLTSVQSPSWASSPMPSETWRS